MSRDGSKPAETPPRAWGRRRTRCAMPMRPRNTPTGVGKTGRGRAPSVGAAKHPHGRGEDPSRRGILRAVRETPPRAWGRRRKEGAAMQRLGNTPTGVGKTDDGPDITTATEKHPHGRGEDWPYHDYLRPPSETPPRAWGRPALKAQRHAGEGNTPTGVGKTLSADRAARRDRKHPHGRGEDSPVTLIHICTAETPPRAWGRQCLPCRINRRRRNTPTGVGKTLKGLPSFKGEQKHPHGRGEDVQRQRETHNRAETPPRAWGRQYRFPDPRKTVGNTPTGVGKTSQDAIQPVRREKHPHGRGEDPVSVPAA